jgi:hypothetical protein
MTAIEQIKTALEQSKSWAMALINDVKDAPTTAPTVNGGNHPHWVLGHIIHSEAGMVNGFIQGQPNPLAKWDALFGMGTQPDPQAAGYPPMDELLGEYEKTRTETLKVLDGMSDADLDRPSHAPGNLAPMFGTYGKCFSMLSLHATFHAGQVADARLAAGKKPLFS